MIIENLLPTDFTGILVRVIRIMVNFHGLKWIDSIIKGNYIAASEITYSEINKEDDIDMSKMLSSSMVTGATQLPTGGAICVSFISLLVYFDLPGLRLPASQPSL